VTGLGTILTGDHRTLIAGVDLPAQCCVKHFSICKTARMYEKSINDSSNSSRWRYY
jgi:hypothetical protein